MRDGFEAVVIKVWNTFDGSGAPDRYLSDKHKFVKEAIRVWKRVEFDKECKDLVGLRTKVNDIEMLAESRLLSDCEVETRSNYKEKIIELENMAKLDLEQKTKIKWLADGDENTSFFHKSLKSKNRKNNIHGMMVNNLWITDCKTIKQETWKFFSAKFHETCQDRPHWLIRISSHCLRGIGNFWRCLLVSKK